MSIDPDLELRARFRELREHDRAAVPEFERTLSRVPVRASRRGTRVAWGAGGVVLAAAAGLLLLLRAPLSAPDAEFVALPAWQSPTDFLLAGANGSLARLSWAPSPTFALGETSFTRLRENR